MKRKTLHVINNPRLDRIFSEAYRNTMKKVAVREQTKHDEDFFKTFSDLFEQDLYNRDLTAEERREFMTAFHREITSLEEDAENRQEKKKKAYLIGGSALFGALVIFFSIYIAVARPFMPVGKVTSELDYYLEKVDDGYGSYAKKFYRLIDSQGHKLAIGAESAYRADMYNTLEDHFDETIGRLEAGEIRYYDDAKEWASRFPEAEERTDRKEIADNALNEGLGEAFGETLDEVKEGAKEFFKNAADFIKDAVNREEQ